MDAVFIFAIIGPMDDPRLDEVATQWSLLRLAHSADVASTADARQSLLLRYRGAIRGYVLALLRNDTDADDVEQDVFLRLMRGDFAGADPSRGRFRDLLKISIKSIVRSHWDRSKRQATKSVDVSLAEDAADNPPEADQWDAHWRQQLLDAAWNALRKQQAVASREIAYSVLRLRSEHPDDDSQRLAERLPQATGQAWRADAFRQQLRRASQIRTTSD
jgi:RNA polymerase sigma factor (sigma-70 family)